MACFLVLGPPRSGTSLAAGIIHALGVPMGEWIDDPVEPRWDFATANEWNPKGFFEDASFSNWCRKWTGGWPWPNRDVEPSSSDMEELVDLVRRRSEKAKDWGVKCAALAYALPQFLKVCPDVRPVYCWREPSAAMKSWNARTGGNDGANAVTAIIRQLQRHAGTKPGLELVFDAQSIGRWPQLIADYCGRGLTEAAAEFPDPSLLRF